MPGELASRLERKEPWFWSTRVLGRGDLYDPTLVVAEATKPVDDYLAIAHVGHGANSYFLTYQLVYRRLALFAQVAWGGLGRSEKAAAQGVRSMFAAVTSLIDVADRDPAADAELRLVVLDSRTKDIDVCTWVLLDGRRRPELERWPRFSSSMGAVRRGTNELARAGGLIGGLSQPDLRVQIELDWEPVGEVAAEAGRLVFPTSLPAGPGIYRLMFQGVEPARAYVGEASDIRRRGRHYRRGDPSLRTNQRLNDRLLKHLAAGGAVSMEIVQGAAITVDGHPRPLDLRRKASRVLAEAAAIHALPDGVVLENLPGAGDIGEAPSDAEGAI
jgi:hypothetical protein